MPNKKTFDLVVITALLLHPAIALAKIWAAKESAEGDNNWLTRLSETVLGLE